MLASCQPGALWQQGDRVACLESNSSAGWATVATCGALIHCSEACSSISHDVFCLLTLLVQLLTESCVAGHWVKGGRHLELLYAVPYNRVKCEAKACVCVI